MMRIFIFLTLIIGKVIGAEPYQFAQIRKDHVLVFTLNKIPPQSELFLMQDNVSTPLSVRESKLNKQLPCYVEDFKTNKLTHYPYHTFLNYELKTGQEWTPTLVFNKNEKALKFKEKNISEFGPEVIKSIEEEIEKKLKEAAKYRLKQSIDFQGEENNSGLVVIDKQLIEKGSSGLLKSLKYKVSSLGQYDLIEVLALWKQENKTIGNLQFDFVYSQNEKNIFLIGTKTEPFMLFLDSEYSTWDWDDEGIGFHSNIIQLDKDQSDNEAKLLIIDTDPFNDGLIYHLFEYDLKRHIKTKVMTLSCTV